jgi:UDP-glucose:tetrahydrobiopterin glucosyltransferase
MATQRILIVSTPVGPLGSGIGGGVELTLHSLVLGLAGRGHHVEVVAPAGSLHIGARVHHIVGEPQVPSQTAGRDEPIVMPAHTVLGAMWERVRLVQDQFDVILNMAYDWLPLYLTPFLRTPVAHLISMGSLNEVMDHSIADLVFARPGSAAVHSKAQAETFPHVAALMPVLGNGIAVERYDARLVADSPPWLGFVGRISKEKGIDDVFAVSARTGLPVRAFGLMQDEACWEAAQLAHPQATVSYEGFLPTDDLQAALGGCTALLMTPKWVEAFGNVAIEAMATATPVIAYRRGGPAEIIDHGVTGFLVEPDDIDGLVAAVHAVPTLDRWACRTAVERRYSTEAMAERVERWLADVAAVDVPPTLAPNQRPGG